MRGHLVASLEPRTFDFFLGAARTREGCSPRQWAFERSFWVPGGVWVGGASLEARVWVPSHWRGGARGGRMAEGVARKGESHSPLEARARD